MLVDGTFLVTCSSWLVPPELFRKVDSIAKTDPVAPDVERACGQYREPHSPTSLFNSSISTRNASYSAIFRFKNRAVRVVFAATPAGVSR